MKKLILIPLLACLIGCVKFSTHVFRTEQAAVNLAYGAYNGYTQALPQLKLTAEQSNAVRRARLEFAASVAVVDGWRMQYETNSAVQPQVQASLNALASQSSNLLWVIAYIRAGK